MKRLCALMLLSAMILTGCGETFSGIGKDTSRVGRGIRTIFVRDSR